MLNLAAALFPLLLSSPPQALDLLSTGPFYVGFKQQWHFDYGRTYQMKLKGGGEYAKGKGPRPILMNLWYPATVSRKARAMQRGAYLDFTKGNSTIKAWTQAYAAYNRDVIAKELMGMAEKDFKQPQRTGLNSFFKCYTNSFAKAPPAKGKFPLVFYHAGYGSSMEDNAEFCEYLASHGYVVVSSSYLDGDGETFNIDALDGSMADIRYLTAYLRKQPNVDWRHIGMVGHSGGAHTALKYRAVAGTVVDAIVSLDTTEDYHSLDDPRWTFIKHDILPNLYRMKGSIMMVANPPAFFDLADRFKGADRHYLTLELGHNEFISQGVFRAMFDEVLAPEEKKFAATQNRLKVDRRYRYLCDYIRFFLDAKLKGVTVSFDHAGKRYLSTPLGGELPHLERVPVGVTTPPPFDPAKQTLPTPRQFRPLLNKVGATRLAELLRAHYNKSNPIYEQVFVYALEYQLLKNKREEEAKILHEAYKSVGVNSARMFISQAWFGDLTKNYTFTEECLLMLLTLEPDHAEAKKKLEENRLKMKK